MECNKEEARRAMDIAQRKLSKNDYNGAKKFVNKAQDMYPALDGLKQVMTIIDVYISASNQSNGADWYGILGVDPLADDRKLKKQYKKLALLLHPDKNKFHGAEGAFVLVSDAFFLLSDHSKRMAYDQTRKSKEYGQKARDHASYSSAKDPRRWFDDLKVRDAYSTSESDSAKEFREWFEKQKVKDASRSTCSASDNAKKDPREWFDEVKVRHASTSESDSTKEFREWFDKQKVKDASSSTSVSYSAKKDPRGWFDDVKVRDASTSESDSAKEFREWFDKQKLRDASCSTSCASDNAKKDPRGWFAAATARVNEKEEAERLSKKPTGNANSTFEAQRIFKI
ncbi:hypothetical protein EUTSA_v10012020mg [Eutrema salsugineum]|uniref:J domain-containing protein n=1 Tax=Eutrema salsugineum TaxID=72664 RepID=V4KLU6_EUTSA|nr:chaperone protein dnaJ 49 [Eutrema salsugineum]ESQ30902.1 hypothetical protein EUTSA_v10012020mg [Eutrema salsugineum]